MTNKEAIEYLKEAQSHIDLEMGGNTQKMYDAIDMAIKALENRPTGNNEYKRGWNDALAKALEEAHTIHSEDGIFQVIQAETLIGLGYATGE